MVDVAVSSAKNGPSDGSLLLAMAEVRRTLVWISRYQSLIMRSLASGCCIMSCVAWATFCIWLMPIAVINIINTNTSPKPPASRVPMFRFFMGARIQKWERNGHAADVPIQDNRLP